MPVIASPRSDAPPARADAAGGARDRLQWSGRISLTRRILTVNIVALLLLAGGFFYLDSFRSRIIDGRVEQARREGRLIAEALAAVAPADRDTLVVRLAGDTGTRLRLYTPDRALAVDSRALGYRNFQLLDPDRQPWEQAVARFLDAVIDTVVGATRAPLYRERAYAGWPDLVAAERGAVAATVWRAPDRTPVITAAAPLREAGGIKGGVVMTTVNARDITQQVRVERFRLSLVLATVTLLSILLSLFLARTIVKPLRMLARAAIRVRRGRAREVVVPRLPERRDEIGSLARALSDMSQALRARIDATEAFAADVTHELKNPLASLRSAVDALGHVEQPELRARLLAIVADDVRRLDRLISDISEASRLDAQLSRAKFEPLDLGAIIEALVAQREARGLPRGIRLRLDRAPDTADAGEVVMGEGARLERVYENLIDNALSFSPDGGIVTIATRRVEGELVVQVDDEGPGVPEDQREAVFRRFQSIRPEGEAFGQHSGLGLAIARTIVEAHGGVIAVGSREDRLGGARFTTRLPAAYG